MKIFETERYQLLTEYLRGALKGRVDFGEDGFSYTSLDICIVFRKMSKSRYELYIAGNANIEREVYTEMVAPIKRAIELIKFDATGAFVRDVA